MLNQLNPRNIFKMLPIVLLWLTSAGFANDLKPVRAEGVLIEVQDQMFRLLDAQGNETIVRVTDSTEIVEDHKNFFREPRQFRVSDLRPGLSLSVKGVPNQSGTLEALKIKFTNKARKMAIVMDSALVPVESELADLRRRDEAIENNLDDFEKSYQETRKDLSQVKLTASQAKGTADQALASAETAHGRIDDNDRRVKELGDRLRLINDFFVAREETVLFEPGSAELTAQARASLESLGLALKEENTLVEVIGFASADGNEAFNRKLSQRRAEAVQRYLIEKHGVELRRFVSPFGLGELRPIADNQTAEGRQKNRRAEIRVLSSRGLEPAGTAASPDGGQ